MLSSRRSSQPRDQIQVSHIGGGLLTVWGTREAQEYWSGNPFSLQGIFPGTEQSSPHCRQILYQLSCLEAHESESVSCSILCSSHRKELVIAKPLNLCSCFSFQLKWPSHFLLPWSVLIHQWRYNFLPLDWLQMLPQHFICVCVCVCVWERERQRQRQRVCMSVFYIISPAR